MKKLTSAFVLSAIIALAAPGANAQTFNSAQIKQDAKLSASRQRDPAVQARLQQWFMAKVRAYQSVLDDTAIGKASPKTIDLGDWTARFQEHLAPPAGRGTTTITFGDVGAPSTMEDTREIIFPVTRADALIDGSPDTCWHEFNHVIVLASEAAGRPVALPNTPWSVYAKPGDNSNIEHVYMEGLGEYTMEWLDLLLHERSRLTGGVAMGFEKHARAAREQVKAYEARGESISYAVENFCWAKAHDAYCRAWKDAGKNVAPLPLAYRQDYQQICGVWVGFVEDVVKLYMGGGLKAADGTPIRVPEWVMNPDPMKTGIIVGHLDEKKTISGDSLRLSFDVRVLENYRRKERSDMLNSGKALISLENADANSKIELSVDGKPVQRSAASGKIDLTGLKKTSRIGVAFVHNKLSALAGVKRYRITVEYQPDPRIEGGVQKPPFYYDSKAIYYVDVTGAGSTAAAKPATPAGGAAAAPGSAGGSWVLKEVAKSHRFYEEFKNQPGLTGDGSVDDTKADLTWTHELTHPTRTVIGKTTSTWQHPGQTLDAGSTINISFALKDAGSSGIKYRPGVHDASLSMSAWQEMTSGMSYGLWTHVSGGRESSGGMCSIVMGSPDEGSDSKSVPAKIPAGKPGERLVIRFVPMASPMVAEVSFIYEWQGGGEKPAAGKPGAVLVAEEAPAQPEPEGMDNVPPEPGELVKIPPVEEKEPPKKVTKPAPEGPWYTHPSGGYRFRLSSGWTVSLKHLLDDADDGYDTLWPADQQAAIVCARDYTDNGSRDGEAVLKVFAAKHPDAKVSWKKLGLAQAVVLGEHDGDSGVMTWHVGMFHKGRSYYISVSMPAEKAPAAMPDPMAWMLGTMEMK